MNLIKIFTVSVCCASAIECSSVLDFTPNVGDQNTQNQTQSGIDVSQPSGNSKFVKVITEFGEDNQREDYVPVRLLELLYGWSPSQMDAMPTLEAKLKADLSTFLFVLEACAQYDPATNPQVDAAPDQPATNPQVDLVPYGC
ncbi:MAG: hypothetical protein LBJ89_05035 [Holosporales bacterium]|jgi:hypothetical protein|nr:hypothetical protein [Holosporales bacterium]